MTSDASSPSDRLPPRGAGSRESGLFPQTPAQVPAALRWTRHLVFATVVGTALLGAVGTHWVGMLVVAPGLGVFFAGIVALVDSDFPRALASRRAVVYAVVTGVVLVPFANGLAMLGRTGGAVLMGLIVLTPFLVGELLVTASARDAEASRTLLRTLSTAQLIREWEKTGALVGTSRKDADAAEVRAALLDELTRRDPEGVTAWLTAGTGSPVGFVRSDRDLAG